MATTASTKLLKIDGRFYRPQVERLIDGPFTSGLTQITHRPTQDKTAVRLYVQVNNLAAGASDSTFIFAVFTGPTTDFADRSSVEFTSGQNSFQIIDSTVRTWNTAGPLDNHSFIWIQEGGGIGTTAMSVDLEWID